MGRLKEMALSVPPRPKAGGTCSVAIVRSLLEPEDIATFNGYLADQYTWPATRLCILMGTILGRECSIGPIVRHRRGECQCPR